MTDRIVRPLRMPRTLAVAGLMVAGIWLADGLKLSPLFCMVTSSICVFATWALRQRQIRVTESLMLCCSILCLSAAFWSIRSSGQDGRDIGVLVADRTIRPNAVIRLRATVTNIPALDTPTTRWDAASRNNDGNIPRAATASAVRTLFLVRANELIAPDGSKTSVKGACRVLSEGDATRLIRWGDRVELLGSIDIADPPMNPGEFDFARHLERNRISAMLFLKHSASIQLQSRSPWNPANWLTVVRQQAVFALKRNLSPTNQGTAEALLLGNRGHLTPDLERDYVSSGTMHLLAISGLHVGILHVFLLRMGNLLIVPRHRVLIFAGLVCVFYCLLTDLRPSVMRATVFIVLNILGQLCCREVRMGSQIGATSLLLILLDPSIVFDIGAWLSFLAVGALGWVSDQTPALDTRPAPPDEVTWRDRFDEWRQELTSRLALSYRQMMAVTLLSTPVVASQFHVVSLIGMVINILLIPFTSVTLISGYVLVVAGILIPPLAFIPGFVFDVSLSALNWTVAKSADVPLGFVTIPDLPGWFLPTYYAVLFASAIALRSMIRQSLRAILLGLVIGVFWNADVRPKPNELVCTTLSVGHGNAIVAELPDGRILLFDAGALNRAERTADVISNFLWHRGYRMIDAIVISHADADHYNAVRSLLEKIPVGQVLMTNEFARSDVFDVTSMISSLEAMSLPTNIMMDGDEIELSDVSLKFLQATTRESSRANDNADSLVCILEYSGRTICLPGDLEDYGQDELLPRLPDCDLLISPHHGSLASNNSKLTEALTPEFVFVSSRDHDNQTRLESIFTRSSLHFTCLEGALTFRIGTSGSVSVEPFRPLQNDKGGMNPAQLAVQ